MKAVAIGDELRLGGYALAGAAVRHAGSAAEAVAAWEALEDGVALLVLTRPAHDALSARLDERPELLWAVVP